MEIDPWNEKQKYTAVVVTEDGDCLKGYGFGAVKAVTGELCFNTAMTGYQEILTDPSYFNQVVMFTFPHIGIAGTNDEDNENPPFRNTHESCAKAVIVREMPQQPSNWRSTDALDVWTERAGIVGICAIDSRALTCKIRERGMIKVAVAHSREGVFDIELLQAMARECKGTNVDLASEVSTKVRATWSDFPDNADWSAQISSLADDNKKHVVLIDFGVKSNILNCLARAGLNSTIVPSDSTIDEVMALRPDGIFLSNGPGDPRATYEKCKDLLAGIIASDLPIFGICFGHQMLALALGGTTKKMTQGHHGANHPVFYSDSQKVEIVSMNHGYVVDGDSLPDDVEETGYSLFDRTNCGLRHKTKAIMSVQQHPEASPGPQDSYYLYEKFAQMMDS